MPSPPSPSSWAACPSSIFPTGRAAGIIDAEAVGNLGGDPDGADGSAFLQLNAIEGGEGGEIALVLKGEFDGGDLSGIAVGEVGDVAFFDFAVLAEGFAEVDGLVGFAVGGGPASAGNVHVHTIKHYSPIINRQLRLIIKILHVYIFRAKIDLTP